MQTLSKFATSLTGLLVCAAATASLVLASASWTDTDLSVLVGVLLSGLFLVVGGVPWRPIQFVGIVLSFVAFMVSIATFSLLVHQTYVRWAAVAEYRNMSHAHEADVRALHPRILAIADAAEKAATLANYEAKLVDIGVDRVADEHRSRESARASAVYASIALLFAALYYLEWRFLLRKRRAA